MAALKGGKQGAGRTADAANQSAAPARSLAELDDIDRRLIQLLQVDGRMSNAAMAREIGASEPTVRKRIERLRADDVIKVTAVLNPRAYGYQRDVLINVRTDPGLVFQVGEKLSRYEQAVYLAYTEGPYQILVDMLFRDDEELLEFLGNELGAIDGVTGTHVVSVLRVERVDFDWQDMTG